MTSFAAHPFHNFHSMNSHNEDNDYILFPNPSMDNHGLFEMGQIQHFVDPTTGEYSYPTTVDEQFTSSAAGHSNNGPSYTDGNHFGLPNYHLNTSDIHAPSSIFSSTSAASLPSASSSATGSPTPQHIYAHPFPDWNHGQQTMEATIYDNLDQSLSVQASGMENDFAYQEFASKPHPYVDPSLINGWNGRNAPVTSFAPEAQYPQQNSLYPPPPSPTPSHHSATSSRPIKQGSASPYLGVQQYQPYNSMQARRPSLISHNSYGSISSQPDGSETSEKGRCNYPDCGKVFKDLKAHRLTHQTERPEKCPIATCDYHIKGFARKYDKNRHTLTHYKGTMVCGFCPGSGSSAEKSFNRADVFKRHLTSVHAVEQTPPNSRKKTPSGGFTTTSAGQKLVGYPSDATGKCSTCSSTFANAQDFYEHLDDCVLRIVQQEDPSEAINAQRLAEVENDSGLKDTLRSNALKMDFSDDEIDDDEKDGDFTTSPSRSNTSARSGKGAIPRTTPMTRPNANGVQKRGLTHSKGGVSLHHPKNRKCTSAQRKEFPPSWGLAQEQINMKKRVMCVFDGSRRLWKDDMMLSTENEVRMRLGGNDNERVLASERYVTDLDVHTLRRAEGFHSATEEEKGPWLEDCGDFDQIQALMEN